MAVINIGNDIALEEMKKRISTATKNLKPGKGQKLEFALINPVAPMGNSSTVIRLRGEEKPVKISLKDKVFIMPENWPVKKKTKLRERLIMDGWQDCTKIVESVPREKKDEPVIYVAGHPDNEPNNPKEGEFVLKYKVGKKNKTAKLQLIKGVIETPDKDLFQALLDQGFSDCGRKPVTDETPPTEEDTDPPEEDSDDIVFDE
jgi:hypothetical protein